MDQQTNEQEPSSTEGGQVKVGDKVWVKCEVVEPCESLIMVTPGGRHNWFWAGREQCRPVEPPVVKDSFTTESNFPKIPRSSSKPMREAFEADSIQRMGKNNIDFSRNENHYSDPQVEMIWQAFQAGVKYGDPSNGWDPTKDKIEYAMDRCGVPASDPIKVGDAVRFVYAEHKHNGAEGTIVLIEDNLERRYSFESNCGHIKGFCTIAELERIDREPQREKDLGWCPVIDPIKVGDSVRFVSPGHKRHGTEGVLKSIHHGPKNAYMFISNCGQFHRYCTASELEQIIKQYRTPTLADLANGPIACEYRDLDEEHWRSGFLVHILNGAFPFLCVNEEQEMSGQWDECRIEAGE